MTLMNLSSELPRPGVLPPPGEVHVWRLDLEADSSSQVLASQVLSDAEQSRASKFLKASDSQHYRSAHTQLRGILGRYCAIAPQAIRFDVTSLGKPSIHLPEQSSQLTFNLSHSGRHGLLALATGSAIGVDLEIQRPTKDLTGLLSQIATLEEARYFMGQPLGDQTRAFFDLWVRKEALLKGIGSGLMADPRTFHVGFKGHSTLSTAADGWTIVDLEIDPSCSAALAVQGPAHQVLLYEESL